MKKNLVLTFLMFLLVCPATFALCFRSGDRLTWESSAARGEMIVKSVNGNKFVMQQTNSDNSSAGVVTLSGEYRSGKYFLFNQEWQEEWIGSESNGYISGVINNDTNFKIYCPRARSNNNNSYNSSYTTGSKGYDDDDDDDDDNYKKYSSNNNILRKGARYTWRTSYSSGEIIVKSVSGNSFVVQQSNKNNSGAGWVTINGTFRNGKYTFNNSRFRETWVLYAKNGYLKGEINGDIDVTIKPSSSSSSSNNGYNNNNSYNKQSFFKTGYKYSWNTKGDSGELVVKSVSGNTIVLKQKNYNNSSAGWVILKCTYNNGKYTIKNSEYYETWVLYAKNGYLKGEINGDVDVTIKPSSSSSSSNNGYNNSNSYKSNHIFKYGNTFSWSTGAGGGDIFVKSVNGNSFVLEQTNATNKGAGTVKLTGSYSNGKYTIKNIKYGETWVLYERNGTLTGKVNGNVNVTITPRSSSNGIGNRK
ncbi:MAG: hypothetical protein PHR45_00735 [Muribaculaceae bacterium]|nr:hypothetical protein [Muribaculaceae bacterium]